MSAKGNVSHTSTRQRCPTRQQRGGGYQFTAMLMTIVLMAVQTRALHADASGGIGLTAGACQHRDSANGDLCPSLPFALRGGQGWKPPGFVACTLCVGVRSSKFGGKQGAPTSDCMPASHRRVGFLRGGRSLPPLWIQPDSGHDQLDDKWPLILSPSRLLSLFLSEVPKVMRYSVSCFIANVLYFGLYSLLLGFMSSAGLCVNLAYLASVVWQHALHRLLVYGKSLQLNALYFKELAGIYMAYSIAFILNPLITEGCISLGKEHIVKTGATYLSSWLHPGAFLVALFVTGTVNFFTVSAVFDKAENEMKAGAPPAKTK
eukprot:CAMPEP_0179426442 /NCGR_PEP_ID=MMETSP0799-20121207/12739_1 /TAXON_ID=46947 /ORGANISM="Geminigera cryophila, Strain CCMP2564" /LENGTH=317 /DNA_ID=CAMNT_0021201191 /DNA_START=129 /DNA_END=1082 /DNA_ORIENTATION=+